MLASQLNYNTIYVMGAMIVIFIKTFNQYSQKLFSFVQVLLSTSDENIGWV